MRARASPRLTRVAIAFLIVTSVAGATVFANGPFAEGTLEIHGTRLTIYSDSQTNDADQVVNVGERAVIRTCYGTGEGPCGTAAASDPGLSGLEVLAELRGPELPKAISMTTVPGGSFVLPGFQQEGDYVLENIRLVDSASGAVLGSAEPSVAVIHVREILLASATVTTLSLADLEARGIAIGQENFQAFDFAVGFLFGTEIVTIELPVLYQGGGEVQVLDRPAVRLDGLPPDVAHVVGRWEPPNIVPFTLEIPEVEPLEVGDEPFVPITFPIFGAIVMPGNVSFLNQFFDATMIVANGAPPGTAVDLDSLQASIKLPNGNVLRVADTEPPVAPGQQVPMVAADGSRLIRPGEQASASWTVEGLVAGTHALAMEVSGDLVRPGKATVPVTTRAQAVVEVVDARFHLVFSHPDVVREGSPYTLFVTVSNLSRVTQNLVSVEIRDQHITGAHKADALDDFVRTIQTLEPGQSETIEYRLVADVTGQVMGGTFESGSSSGSGAIQLYTGVGELGIPLSPATLRLPRFSGRFATPHIWTDDFLSAASRFLGLAYSLAVAPAGMAPPGLPAVIRSDVEARAIDLGYAGQRTFLGERLLESLEVLLLDHLGNREPLVEIDELRRLTDKGLGVSLELARLLRREQEERGLDAIDLFDHFAETTSYADPYLATLLLPGFTGEPPDLELRRFGETGWMALSGGGEGESRRRSLPFAEILAVKNNAVGSPTSPFAVVGSVPPGVRHEIHLRNSTDGISEGRLLLLLADDANGGFRRIDFGNVSLPARTAYRVTVGSDVPDPSDGGFEFTVVATGQPVSGLSVRSDPVPLPPFRVIGSSQDFEIGANGGYRPNRYGQGVSYLFNRPPEQGSAETASHYRIRSTYDSGNGVYESEKRGVQAFIQPSGRVLNVRFSDPISALWDAAADEPLVDHTDVSDWHLVVDKWGGAVSEPVTAPRVEYPPQHYGGLVTGRVLRGTGSPASGSMVRLIRPRLVATTFGFETVLDLVGEMTTGDDGAFYFDFVEQPHPDIDVQDEFMLRALVPAGSDPATEPAAQEEVASTIRLQNQLTTINIALLGRGTVTGELVYLDTGDPVAGGSVTVSSTLFNDTATVTVEGDGSFEVPAMPVGPLTLTGRDPEGRTIYATVGLERPGDTVHVVLELPRVQPPGLGTVVGTVFRTGAGDSPQPAEGATVEAWSAGASLGRVTTDSYGHFRFIDVPAGRVTVQAADWRISRTSVLTDLILAADETAEITLTIPAAASRSVTGTVVFYDPLSNLHLPVEGAAVFISGPGVYAYTDADGTYRIDGVPVQQAGTGGYLVTAIDFERQLEGNVELPPIIEGSPEIIAAQPIVLREMRGGIDGVVLDPLGRPLGGVGVIARAGDTPYAESVSRFDGTFSFDDLPLGEWQVTAHAGDGLEQGRVGYFGKSAKTRIVFGGHRPFASVQMVGSGVVELRVSSGQGSSVWAEVYYRPTYYSEAAKDIVRKGVAIETETDPNGVLQLLLPVGGFEITVFSPFHGSRTVGDEIAWAGQVRMVDVIFDGSSTVSGRLVNTDGVTPIPDFEVELRTETLLPQTQRTDAEGKFYFALVPRGNLEVRAAGTVGTIDRVGVARGFIASGGQTLDLLVRMKEQGTVEGQVFERVGDQDLPLAGAQIYVQEESFPFRRLPAGWGWYSTDSEGRYRVSHVFAGGVRVVARDGNQISRLGSVQGHISSDWQVVEMPDLVLTTSVGSISVTVRDPENGAVLPDTQVTIREPRGYVMETTVADQSGEAVFDALPLWGYFVTAFHAPTGRSGRLDGLLLNQPGQHLARVLFVDQRGSVGGTLFDDPTKVVPVAGATVELKGQTAGGPMTALDTTSGRAEDLGRFEFLGIPEGEFQLNAGVAGSPRRAGAQLELTSTAPVAEVDLVLEAAGDVAFRVFERLSSGLNEIDPVETPISVRLEQEPAYDFTMLSPHLPAPGHAFVYPAVLLERSGVLTAQELGGEQRSSRVAASNFESGGVPLEGSGDAADPYRVVLGAKGIVRVEVRDASDQPVAGASVTVISSGGGRFPSVTGEDGTVSFVAVPAGSLDVSASAPTLGVGGRTTAVLQYDDDIVDVIVALDAAVSAHGVIYEPVPGDVWDGDPSTLVPQAGAIVVFSYDGTQLSMTTGDDGVYRFDALPEGAEFWVSAQSSDGQAIASTSGVLAGPNGHDNEIPPLILDGGPPQIVSITPSPGMEEVSRTADVEVVFSEPLEPTVLPTGQPTTPYFELIGPSGLAVGIWRSATDEHGLQVIRFEPSEPYANRSVYSLRVSGGPQGVRDRIGRPLTVSGDVGSNFTTSDSIGPAVLGTQPALDRPVEGGAPIRFDFNEAITATNEQLDGDGVGDAATLSWGQDDGGGGVIWQPLPASLYLTRNDYSLTVDPVEGLELTDDSLARRIEIAGLEDSQGNLMEPYERQYRIRDANPPAIDELPPPPNAPDGRLVAGAAYSVTPVLSAIDFYPLDPPEGDVDRVEYFFAEPVEGGSEQPGFVATEPPYAFTFVAAYAGNGIDPRPFPIWARAVDTSENASAFASLSLEVLANQPPEIGAVSVDAVSPVEGVFYAGSQVRVTVEGLADEDNAELGLVAELWEEGGSLVATVPTSTVSRPASGDWADLVPPALDLAIPFSTAESTVLFVRVTATDAVAAASSSESARFAVADDLGEPAIEGVVVRSAEDNEPGSLFHIGQEIYIEFTARDSETKIVAVEATVDRTDIFASPLSVNRAGGELYRSEILAVPVDVFSETTSILLTVTGEDRGGNTSSVTHEFEVAPEPDPTAPTVGWLTPWEGAEWPAGYTSTRAPGTGVALLLRVHASDTNEDGGEIVPGTIVEVAFRGPVPDGVGGVVLADTSQAATVVAGTSLPGEAQYQLVWPVPDGLEEDTEVPFEVRVVDSGGLDVVSTVRMRAVPPRAVFEGVETAVLAGDPVDGGDPNGGLFLLDGTTLSLYPQTSGGARLFDSLSLYSGGEGEGVGLVVRPTILTVPAVTSYSSSILYHPLDLEIARVLAVGAEARIDVSGRGLLGSLEGDEMVLPGEIGSDAGAGGSHGGSGWYGIRNSWDQPTWRRPSSIFDSVRNPALPGAGGGGEAEDAGGAGGGVLRVEARDASIRLIGEIRSNGGPGIDNAGGGAGGAIRLAVRRLEGSGRIVADGGATARWQGGGGGGGRIAVLARELGSGFDPISQIRAAGGFNGDYLAGAGTVFFEESDFESGAFSGIGTLVVANPLDEPAGATLMPAIGGSEVVGVDPLSRVVTVEAIAQGDVTGDGLVLENSSGGVVALWPITAQSRVIGGVELTVDASEAELVDLQTLIASDSLTARSRTSLGIVRASGSVRLAFDDDLEIGAADDPAPVLNAPSSLILEDGARAALRFDRPTLELTPLTEEGSEVLIGTQVQVNRVAEDPLGVFEIVEAWPPTGTDTGRFHAQPLSTAQWPGPYTFSIPVGTEPGETTLEMTVRNVAGRSTTEHVSWILAPDEDPPEITIELDPPADGDIYTAGTWVTITVTAADNVRMGSLRLTFDGETSEGFSWLQRQWVVPVVPESTPFEIAVEAIDEAGNVATAARTLMAEPTDDTGAPVVSILCPFDGDACAPGSPMNIAFAITDEEMIESYLLSVNGEPLGERVTVNRADIEGSVSWTPPPTAVAGETFTVMIEARDFAANTGFAIAVLTIPDATILAGSQEITLDYTGQDLVLGAGTMTTTTALTPASLTLLNGAVLTSPVLEILEITTPGQVTVSCGAAIDVSGRGYRAGETYPGAALPVDSRAAGSHVGAGYYASATLGATYGSVTRPREFGAGRVAAGSDGRGGGVVVIDAGAVQHDGEIKANGPFDAWGCAGGSVSITAGDVLGRGAIEASSLGNDGGGGAIAVIGDVIEPAIVEGLSAIGGEGYDEGGAGTVFVFDAGSTFGDLEIEPTGYYAGWTNLPTLGGGTAQANSGGQTLITDRTQEIPDYFVGHWVQISSPDGTVKGTWRIEDVDGFTATLETRADVLEGDAWQGVYRFDSVTVRRYGRLRIDDLDDFGGFTAEENTYVFLFNREDPTVDLGRITFGTGNQYSTIAVRGEPGAVTDPNQRVEVEILNTVTGEIRGVFANADGSFAVGVNGTCGDPLVLTATDEHVLPRSTTVDLGPMPDVVPPAVIPDRVHFSVSDRQYRVWNYSWAVPIIDACGLDYAELIDPARPEAPYPVEIDDSGSILAYVDSSLPGTELILRAVDLAGNETSRTLAPLPANEGPPEIDVSRIVPTTAGGDYLIESSGQCGYIDFKVAKSDVICDLPVESDDGILNSRFENRTTPVFGPFEFEEIAECEGCYRFDPVVVDGALGDEIWLVAEDNHPGWLAAEALVWTLPVIPGAPWVALHQDNLGWVDGEYLLAVFEGEVSDADGPLTLDVQVWRQAGEEWHQVHGEVRSMTSGEGLTFAIPGGATRDLVLVSATDSAGLKTTVRVGNLPPPEPITVFFEEEDIFVGEDEGGIGLRAMPSSAPLTDITVGYRTVAGTAEEGADYESAEGVITFPSGDDDDVLFDVFVLEDIDPEPHETFRVELFDPVGAELGTPSEVEITIVDNDTETVTVPFSVAVGFDNHLESPIGVDVVGGVAAFAEPLPHIAGRGDRVEIDPLGTVFISECEDEWVCTVVDGRGLVPDDAVSATANVVAPAFGSLAEAVQGATDADHLGTSNLVSINRAVEFVCYGGIEDTTAVAIGGWVTSPENDIRIVAADPSFGHGPEWRHPGRWSGGAYRIEVWNDDCIRSTVGNLRIEGVQFLCSGDSGVPVHAINLLAIDGEVEISEALIHLAAVDVAADRSAVKVSSWGQPEVVVRNSMMWDLGDAANHVGILVEDANVTLDALNNTIVGGGFGIHNLGSGTVTAINNLVAGTTIASYEGSFEPASSSNLASDNTAPDPPPTAGGPVTVVNPATSFDADLHLRCGILDQEVTIDHQFEVGSDDDLWMVFDGNPDTLLRSADINPATVTLEFAEERAAVGTSVVLSHFWSHRWKIEAADTVDDLAPGSSTYRLLVDWREVENEQIAWDGVTFAGPESFRVIRLTVHRDPNNPENTDNYVHVNDWLLDGLNPACGQGVELSDDPLHPFVIDVDSAVRTGPWDIGADQSQDLTVGFLHGPWEWWEEEGTAYVEVVLSEPAPTEVTVQYRTEEVWDSATPDLDYTPDDGVLVFAPGEFSKLVPIAISPDFEDDDGEVFRVVLSAASGARIGIDGWEVTIRDGDAPLRVSLAETVIDVVESDGSVFVDVVLSEEYDAPVSGTWDSVDGSAKINADYRGTGDVGGAPWANYEIPAGETTATFEFEILFDLDIEGDEGFVIKGGWPNDAQPGVPSVGYVRILDDDGGSP